MYIHRIILRDVRTFVDEDILLYDDLWQKPLNSVLLMGPNGSGKTTLLRIVIALWDSFRWWISLSELPESQMEIGEAINPFLKQIGGLVAIEIRDFGQIITNDVSVQAPASIWLFSANSPQYRDSLTSIVADENAAFVGSLKDIADYRTSEIRKNTHWLKPLNEMLARLERLGNREHPLANIVYFDAQNRTIPVFEYEMIRNGRAINTQPPFLWTTIYDSEARTNGHLEMVLANIKLDNPQKFNTIRTLINQFFANTKEIQDFHNGRLMIKVHKPRWALHAVDELSSGEKQCLIMMVTVFKWLENGGIVLIDEPDLHLHVSLQRQLISAIEKIVHERGGQLIITSHSPEMWDKFYDSQKVRLKLDVEEIVHE